MRNFFFIIPEFPKAVTGGTLYDLNLFKELKNKYFPIYFFSKWFRFMPQTSKIQSKLPGNQLCKKRNLFCEILSNIDISASRSSCILRIGNAGSEQSSTL